MNMKALFVTLLCVATLPLAATHAWAFQAQQVSGKVLDAANQEPLIGVNVVIKGTTQGTSTDADGVYTLSVPSPDVTLVFTYI